MTNPPKENSADEIYARATVLERRLRGLKRNIIGIGAVEPETLSDADADIFEARLTEAKTLWTEFRDAWNEREELSIKIGADDTFPSDAWYHRYDAVKEEIVKASGALISIKKREMRMKTQDQTLTASSSINTSGTYLHKPQLPRIPIPTFHGDIIKWSHFRDTFESMIHHEPTLTKVEKFHYLIGALKGEAASLISRFPVEEQSYELAWKKVVETYQNPRVLANILVHRMIDFDLKPARSELQKYEFFLTGVADSIDAFRALRLKDPTDFLLATLALRALDSETRRQFELSLESNQKFPTVDNVINFVRQRKTAIKMSQDVDHSLRKAPARTIRNESKRNYVTLHSHSSSSNVKKESSKACTGVKNKQEGGNSSVLIKCCLCKGNHLLSKCDAFLELPLDKRLEQVRSLKVCWNCLRNGHRVSTCNSKFRCRTCNRRHHTLIHSQAASNNEMTVPDLRPSAPAETFIGFGSTPSTSSSPEKTMVLLGTTRILVKSQRGDYHFARAVLDSGSQHTFITSALARKIGARILPFDGCITSLGESAVPRSHLKGSTCMTIRSCAGKDEFNLSSIVVDRITSALPSCDLPATIINRIMCQPLADQQFGESGSVELLIGGDLYPRLLTGASYPTEVQDLFFTPTVFGLVVSGVVHDLPATTSCSFFSASKSSIEENLKAFWELEEPTSVDRSRPEDVQCEQHFIKTHSRTEDGRYVVRLPFRSEHHQPDDNKAVALRRFYALESKFRRDPDLSEKYKNFMREYCDL